MELPGKTSVPTLPKTGKDGAPMFLSLEGESRFEAGKAAFRSRESGSGLKDWIPGRRSGSARRGRRFGLCRPSRNVLSILQTQKIYLKLHKCRKLYLYYSQRDREYLANRRGLQAEETLDRSAGGPLWRGQDWLIERNRWALKSFCHSLAMNHVVTDGVAVEAGWHKGNRNPVLDAGEGAGS